MIRAIIERLKNRYVANTFIYMAGDVLSPALALFILPIFTRHLSTEEYGIFNYTTSIQSVLFIVTALSLNSFILRHYFEIESETDRARLFGSTFLFLMIFSSIMLTLEFLAFPRLIKHFNVAVPFEPFFKLALISNFLDMIAVVPLACFRARKQAVRYFALSGSKAALTYLLAFILVVPMDMGVLGRYYGIVIMNVVFALIYIPIIFRMSAWCLDWRLIARGLRFSLPLVPAAFAAMAIVSVDRLILERYVSISQIGIYSVAVTLGTMLLIVVRAFYRAVEPRIFEIYKEANFNEHVLRMKKYLVSVILLAGCLFIIFCRELVQIFLGSEFHECYRVMPFLVAACVFRGAEVLVSTTLHAVNKTVYQPFIVGVGLAVNVILNFALIPHWGILGAAASSTLAFWSLYIISAYLTQKFCAVHWKSLSYSLIIAACCLISTAVMHLTVGGLLATLAVKTGVAMAAMLIGFLVLRRRLNRGPAPQDAAGAEVAS